MATTKKVLEIEIDVDSGDVKKLNKEIGNTKKEVKATSQSTSGLTSQLDKMTGGMLTGVKSVITGFKTMKFAIAATGIGALIIAVAALGAAFTSSEEGQNKFAKIMGVIGAITGNLVDLLADLGEKIIWVFENPQQALEDFGNLIKENLLNRFNGLLELIPELGKAVELLFEGEFSEAGKVALNATAKVAIGVEDLTGKIEAATEAVTEFIEENLREAQVAADIANARAEADKVDRKLLVARAEANRDRAELLDKVANKEKFTVQQRINFLKEAALIEQNITDQEIKNANDRLFAKIAENALSKSGKEDLKAEAELQALVIDLETAKLRKQKLVTSQITAALKEAAAEEKAIKDKAAAEEKEREAAKLKSEKEIRDIIAGWDKEDAANKKQADQDKLEADKMLTSLNISNMEEGVAKELALNQAKHDALREQAKGNAEILTEIDIAQAAEVAKIEEEAAAKKKANEKAAADATVAVATATIGSLSALNKAFSKDDEKGRRNAFKREKALGIASAVINTAKSAVSAYNSMAGIPFVGPVLAPIAAAAAIAAGAAQIKNITKQKYKGESGGGGGGGASGLTASGGGSAPSAPQFNTVGTSGFNQINESLNNNNRNPTKAYVVSGEVSSAQSLDRNRIKEATFP
jgi:hypothetical protein